MIVVAVKAVAGRDVIAAGGSRIASLERRKIIHVHIAVAVCVREWIMALTHGALALRIGTQISDVSGELLLALIGRVGKTDAQSAAVINPEVQHVITRSIAPVNDPGAEHLAALDGRVAVVGVGVLDSEKAGELEG